MGMSFITFRGTTVQVSGSHAQEATLLVLEEVESRHMAAPGDQLLAEWLRGWKHQFHLSLTPGLAAPNLDKWATDAGTTALLAAIVRGARQRALALGDPADRRVLQSMVSKWGVPEEELCYTRDFPMARVVEVLDVMVRLLDAQ